MEIILSNHVKSLTGSLGRGLGYHIKHRKNGFFGERNSNGSVPPDGHWRFIIACAELAQMSLHISDIQLSRTELESALNEAHAFIAAQNLRLNCYHARDILNLKTTFGL
jgi:hypothetical protein